MIKHLRFALLAMLFSLAGYSYAQQACTPDPQYTNPDTQRGVYPDSATNFGPAYAGTPYMQLVTVVVPPDTAVAPPPFPAIPFDSIVLVNVTGLPNGFTYACWNNSPNPNRCSWPGNTIGCMQIDGNPTIADTGTYMLDFTIDAYVGGSTAAQTFNIDYYKIVVNPPLGVHDALQTGFSVAQNQPNPFRGKTRISYTVPSQGEVSIVVYNMLGKEVYSAKMIAQKGENHMELAAAQLVPGIYMYTISRGNTMVTKRMVVEGK